MDSFSYDPAQLPAYCLAATTVCEPDAGNLPVRFDEEGQAADRMAPTIVAPPGNQAETADETGAFTSGRPVPYSTVSRLQ